MDKLINMFNETVFNKILKWKYNEIFLKIGKYILKSIH